MGKELDIVSSCLGLLRFCFLVSVGATAVQGTSMVATHGKF